MRARPSAFAAAVAVGALTAILAGCSTGVAEADRAIFVNACTGVTNATNPACACAFDELGGSGSDRVLNETIDSLQRGQAPPRLTRAIARCSTQN
jgi:hypothetical protein